MPLTPPGIAGAIIGNLAATSILGMSVPLVATGLASGLMQWVPTITVLATASGTAGVGVGVLPLIVPSPTLIGAFGASFPASSIVGPLAAPVIAGLSNGLSLAFLQGLITVTHPIVGAGAGVAKIVAPPAIPFILSGFASAGLTGISVPLVATAIGVGLTTVFNALAYPIAIAGPPSPSPAAGVGVGKIL